jgi:hypothetical protein
LADWLKLSSVPEFSEGEDAGTPFPASPAPTTVYPPGTAENAYAASSGNASDVFAAPAPASSAGSADLFASPVSAAPEPAPTPSFAFGGSSGGHASEARLTGGNGAASQSMLTGQRHENSVLFSLSNLEALAGPSTPASLAPRPGVSSGSPEGSGLIDIRSMAAMTLGGKSEGGSISSRPSNDLPTFGAPQFSPVAPVLLPIGQASGPPKWAFIVIGVGLLVAIALGAVTYYVATRPAPVATAPAAPTAATAPVAAPKPATPPTPAVTQPATPPTTPPVPANEVLPPRDKPAVAAVDHSKTARKTVLKGGVKGGRPGEVAAAGPAPGGPGPAPTQTEKVNTGKPDKLDELLNAAIGSKPKPAAPSRSPDEEAPKRAAPAGPAALPALEKGDIVRAMMAVSPKVKDCYNQYKVPGTAMVAMKLARGGRVVDATVSGKFAGTPTGACVESAARGAKFPPTEAQTFQYPFSLH